MRNIVPALVFAAVGLLSIYFDYRTEGILLMIGMTLGWSAALLVDARQGPRTWKRSAKRNRPILSGVTHIEKEQ